MKHKFILFYLTLLFVMAASLTFWDKGYIDYTITSGRNDSLHVVLDSVERANILLKAEIDSVNNKIPFKLEKIARDKYSMIKPGEQLLIIKSKK